MTIDIVNSNIIDYSKVYNITSFEYKLMRVRYSLGRLWEGKYEALGTN